MLLLLLCPILNWYCQLPNGWLYQLDTPDKTFVMPPELIEISGLGLSTDGRYLLAVQDEAGTVYWLDRVSGELKRTTKFAGKGDYEGIEMVGEEIFVVKSSGTIYQILPNGGAYDIFKKYNFALGAENDVEGLAYDPIGHRLLLACKAQAETQSAANDPKRGIYAFDLYTMQLGEKPAVVILRNDLLDFLQQKSSSKDQHQLLERFKKEDAESFAFAPSAIAVHPQTGHWYILSSVGKTLLVLDKNGKIVHFIKLKKKIHSQPEGLCFDQEGTMYIANEGKGGAPGKIHVFKKQ